MDKIKIDNFSKVHRDKDFPKWTSIDEIGARRIRSKLTEHLGIENRTDDLLLVKKIDSLQENYDAVNAMDEGFSLRHTFSRIGLSLPTRVFINWYRFDCIDELTFDDLDNYFDDFWYPDADDIDIFDPSLTWIFSVSHDGRIKFLKLESKPPNTLN